MSYLRRVRLLAILALSVVLLGCGKDETPGPNARPMDEWRRKLADPEAYSVRSGKKIDSEAMRRAMLEGRDQHREAIEKAIAASVEALPEGTPPTEARYEVLGTFDIAGEQGPREVEGIQAALVADVSDTAKQFASRYLPIVMTQDLGMPGADVGMWVAFFGMAEPKVTKCAQAETELTLCLDYGGLDVLVIDSERVEELWVPVRVQWLQRR